MMEATIVPAEAVLSAQRLWESNGGICQTGTRAESNGKDDIETIGEYNGKLLAFSERARKNAENYEKQI